MNKNRILTAVIYFPIVLIIMLLNKPLLIDILMSLVAIRAVWEFTNCAKNKDYKIISWICYIFASLIAFRQFIEIKLEYVFYSIFEFW